ncbi:MAG: recombinase family protein [Proteobacteria bacterium]|nr:recombinase family protein [Pseudomonadota bacterium]
MRRIFAMFASGSSPQAIAIKLNSEGVAGPRRRPWGPSTIYGNWRRGTGILNNELYVGRLVWNRQRFVKDPTTGRRIAQPNLSGQWVVQEVPALRIVPQELWEAVKRRQQGTRREIAASRSGGVRPERARRPAYLLSGLLRCGACGGGFAMISASHYGCSNARNRGICDNRLIIRRDRLEEAVLAGLKTHLMRPEMVKEFVAEYQRSLNRHAATLAASRLSVERDLARTRQDMILCGSP